MFVHGSIRRRNMLQMSRHPANSDEMKLISILWRSDATWHEHFLRLRVTGTERAVELEVIGVVQESSAHREQHFLEKNNQNSDVTPMSSHRFTGTPTPHRWLVHCTATSHCVRKQAWLQAMMYHPEAILYDNKLFVAIRHTQEQYWYDCNLNDILFALISSGPI